jgi:hypothetical protein
LDAIFECYLFKKSLKKLEIEGGQTIQCPKEKGEENK